MSLEDVQKEIEQQLKKTESRVLNRNAFSALFGAFTDPAGALGKIFLGRSDALDQEKQRIAQEIILKMLCKIDDAISGMESSARNAGVMNVVSGTIEVHAKNSDSAIGVHITGSRATELKPGTHIKTTSSNVRSTTGLKIEN